LQAAYIHAAMCTSQKHAGKHLPCVASRVGMIYTEFVEHTCSLNG